ncbi:hypothetical protein FRAHR75_450040 [Frankia sp. Hr75.2]|nr:hypothetical protein FRAHR75_450040 [Frankia sp. Hr75.2]
MTSGCARRRGNAMLAVAHPPQAGSLPPAPPADLVRQLNPPGPAPRGHGSPAHTRAAANGSDLRAGSHGPFGSAVSRPIGPRCRAQHARPHIAGADG